jgi:hypothetical protein
MATERVGCGAEVGIGSAHVDVFSTRCCMRDRICEAVVSPICMFEKI